MPSNNILSIMAARAKAHHDSLNAAYEATYSPRVSTSSTATPLNSRKSSITSQDAQSERNITKAWKALKKHHQDMNAAYSAYYSPGVSTHGSRASSVAPTPKASFEEERMMHEKAAMEPRNYQKAWRAIKNKAVEHHRSVNSASAAVYGA